MPDDDYRRGEEGFAAMPAGDTPGSRVSVSRYAVTARMMGARYAGLANNWMTSARAPSMS